MNWGSLQDFLAMGGYGRFVWGAYAFCALLVALERWALARRLARALRSLSSSR